MKKGLLAYAIILGLAMCGCELTANTGREPETSLALPVSDNPMDASAAFTPETFTYDVESRNWSDDGITVKYPMLVNVNNQDHADKINDIIMNDISDLLSGLSDVAADASFACDGVYDCAAPDPANFDDPLPKVLSVYYLITYSSDSLAYPVNLYHTVSISLESPAAIALKDLFTIDESFVDSFMAGLYTPYRDDLNLEADRLSIPDLINEQYTTEDLIRAFSEPAASYYLTSQGIILSIPVPHALGDHLEMAVNYEYLELSIKKNHPFWDGYMFLAE